MIFKKCPINHCLPIFGQFSKQGKSCFSLICIPFIFLTILTITPGSNCYGNLIKDWESITLAELAQKKPKIDPDSDAEFIFSKSVYDDSGNWRDSDGRSETIFNRVRQQNNSKRDKLIQYYNRAKIFTERGLEYFTVLKIEIPNAETYLHGFKARVINPDGSVEEVKHKEFHTQKVYESDNDIRYIKSVSLPGLSVGCIIEYKYSLIRETKYVYSFQFIQLMEDFPIWKRVAEIKSNSLFASRTRALNIKLDSVKKVPWGVRVEHANMPGRKTEPFLPPWMEIEPYISLMYTTDTRMPKPKIYWKQRAGEIKKYEKSHIKPNNFRVVKVAKELFGANEDPYESLRKAYQYVTNNIKNLHSPFSGYTNEDIKDFKENKSAAAVIKKGYGWPEEINWVFASLAAAAGFEVHFVDCENRREFRFKENITEPMNLYDRIIAVQKHGQWRYFDPGAHYMPFEQIPARNRGGVILFGDPKNVQFYKIPPSKSEYSPIHREGKFSITKEGTLEGTVTIKYGGFNAIWRKNTFDNITRDESKEEILNTLKVRLPLAQIDNFSIQNLSTREKDLIIGYDVKIPAYGEVLGSRIFLDPGFFEKGKSPVFEKDTRLFNIEQKYPFEIHDSISFSFPEGYKLEEAASPGLPIQTPIISYSAAIGTNKQETRLLYKRDFKADFQTLPVKFYRDVKNIYDEVYRQDQHSLSLKKAVTISK